MVFHGEKHPALDQQESQRNPRNDGGEVPVNQVALCPKRSDPVQAQPEDGQPKAVVPVFPKWPKGNRGCE